MTIPTLIRTLTQPLPGLLVMTLALATFPAAAGGPLMPPAAPAAYALECGTCHTAYPPGLLPARSWQRVMGGLENHYGTDAALDPKLRAELGGWLQQHAGTYKRVAAEPPQDRITRSAWFERKHRKVGPEVWTLPSVKSASQCAACHRGADQGRFGENELITPAGLPARLRRNWND